MSIRPKREKRIKDSQDKSFDVLAHAKQTIASYHERCKCVVTSSKWQKHETFCPIWKNGRIAELKAKLKQLESDAYLDSQPF